MSAAPCYADLPASAVESARGDILDTFGCVLGGSGSPGIGELFGVVSRWGGQAESRVLLRHMIMGQSSSDHTQGVVEGALRRQRQHCSAGRRLRPRRRRAVVVIMSEGGFHRVSPDGLTGVPCGGRRIRTIGPSRVESICLNRFCRQERWKRPVRKNPPP